MKADTTNSLPEAPDSERVGVGSDALFSGCPHCVQGYIQETGFDPCPYCNADNLEGLGPTDEERRENWRELDKLHPGNRFRLMFGMPLLPENDNNPPTA